MKNDLVTQIGQGDRLSVASSVFSMYAYRELAEQLEGLDVVVIDGSLVWCGDAAPLAYPRRDDCTLRFVSREVAAELAETLKVQGV